MDREKVIKGLENTEIMLKQAVDRGGEMAVMGAFKCYNHVSDALALLKEQKSDVEKLNGFINGFSKDAIVPVRCKDCKYYDYHNGCMSWHDVNSKNDNWYCADGERRTDDA